MTSDLDRRTEALAAPAPRRERVLARVRELAKFGSVGAVAYVVDLGLFNLLSFGPGEVLGHKPLTAKVLSVAVATLVAWVGNRYWTFSARRTATRGRELAAFVVVNVGGMLIAVGCLAISTYALGLTSPLAKNVSANVVGLALGTAFRYLAYRRLVFTGDRAPDPATTPGA
ncbi:GtrA family protein [Cellulosimicrobium composti]|uniref:GtrA family protein n=1 Tax=Cellulosimicrobium composti TaxID=2672572 RepID=A0ABX0BG28_9MICO|nr:GtrA family protein [Cellulosimicrobium composti]NDO90635.1 GtrA family protein [Cellulosimicrobium composti]